MITNFEKETDKLTAVEFDLIKPLVNGFKTRTAKNPIKAPETVSAMNFYLASKNKKIKMTERTLRKCVGHIRRENILPLIATSKGYFVSYDKGVISSQIQSLTDRAESMLETAEQLKRFLL